MLLFLVRKKLAAFTESEPFPLIFIRKLSLGSPMVTFTELIFLLMIVSLALIAPVMIVELPLLPFAVLPPVFALPLTLFEINALLLITMVLFVTCSYCAVLVDPLPFPEIMIDDSDSSPPRQQLSVIEDELAVFVMATVFVASPVVTLVSPAVLSFA